MPLPRTHGLGAPPSKSIASESRVEIGLATAVVDFAARRRCGMRMPQTPTANPPRPMEMPTTDDRRRRRGQATEGGWPRPLGRGPSVNILYRMEIGIETGIGIGIGPQVIRAACPGSSPWTKTQAIGYGYLLVLRCRPQVQGGSTGIGNVIIPEKTGRGDGEQLATRAFEVEGTGRGV